MAASGPLTCEECTYTLECDRYDPDRGSCLAAIKAREKDMTINTMRLALKEVEDRVETLLYTPPEVQHERIESLLSGVQSFNRRFS